MNIQINHSVNTLLTAQGLISFNEVPRIDEKAVPKKRKKRKENYSQIMTSGVV